MSAVLEVAKNERSVRAVGSLAKGSRSAAEKRIKERASESPTTTGETVVVLP